MTNWLYTTMHVDSASAAIVAPNEPGRRVELVHVVPLPRDHMMFVWRSRPVEVGEDDARSLFGRVFGDRW